MKNILSLMIAATALLCCLRSEAASVPFTLAYQGSVYVDDEVFSGEGSFKAAIVNASGTTLWSNDSSSESGGEPTGHLTVEINEGLFFVTLGDTDVTGMEAIDPAIFNTAEKLYLKSWFSDGVNGFSEFVPSILITSSVYSMNAQLLQGYSPANFLLAGTPITSIQITSGTIDGVTIGATTAPTVTNLGSVATADINGGTIDGVTIGATAPPTVTNLGSVATADINGGTIDGVTIGASSPVTSIGMVGDLTDYEAVNDGNPEIKIGSSDAEEAHMQAVYDAGAQTLDYFLFQTDTTSGTAHKGLFRFNVDGANVVDINDGGINISGGITIGNGISYGGGWTESITTLQTTDATTTDIATFVVAAGGSHVVEVTVIGIQSDEGNRAVYHLEGLFFRNTGGDVTQQGGTNTITSIESNAAWNCTLNPDAANQTVDVRVTGAAATTINWKVVLRTMRATTS